jgi:ubiquinone/menaquinone biosynthesis C-methylase UbiE
MSTKTGTIRSYNQIAERFYENNKDRSQIEGNLDRFVHYCQPNDLILDIGCGPGFDGELLRAKGLRVIGLDLSNQMIKIGKHKFPFPFIQADMETLPILPKIDGLWVNASLLHIEREAIPETLGEFARVLKPRGTLFISVKNGEGEKWEPGDENTPRWFTYWQEDQLKDVLNDGGFQTLEIWSDDVWMKCCAIKRAD